MLDKILFDEDPATANLGSGDCPSFRTLSKLFRIEPE
jgi:hypothetical protein